MIETFPDDPGLCPLIINLLFETGNFDKVIAMDTSVRLKIE